MTETKMDNGAREMPRYQSHKKVWALKIADIDGVMVTPENESYATFAVSTDYLRKHEPKIGGYYVVYDDGYASFSPADAFEGGYTLIHA